MGRDFFTLNFMALLTLLFIALKLTNHIDWSWVLVLSPLWLPWIIVISGAAIVGMASMIIMLIEKIMEKR